MDPEEYYVRVDEPLRRLAALGTLTAVGRGLAWSPAIEGVGALSVRAGDGTDIATAASAGLLVWEQLIARGLAHRAALAADGGDRVIIYLRHPAAISELDQALLAVTSRAPELATTDASQVDGRSLLRVLGPAESVPVPYSLVELAGVTSVLQPMTVDELAALTAGMPLVAEPDGIVSRLQLYGDLTGGLTDELPPLG